MKTISFLGDISLNGIYIDKAKNNENPFSQLTDLLKDTFVVGNLECFVEGNEGENELKKPRLKTELNALKLLPKINLRLALLANNHAYDNLTDGFLKTITKLDDLEIKHIGAGLSEEEARKPYILKKEKHNICFLNYVTEDTHPNLPSNSKVFLNFYSLEQVITDIRYYKQSCKVVIICLHWGGNFEGSYYPDWYQAKHAKIMISQGADLIVGHHSHTCQPYEKFDKKTVFYSIGNFCFSDFTSDKINYKIGDKQRYSLIVKTNLYGDIENIVYTMIDKNNQIIVNNEVAKVFSFNRMIYLIVLKNKVFWFFFKLFSRRIIPKINSIRKGEKSVAYYFKRIFSN